MRVRSAASASAAASSPGSSLESERVRQQAVVVEGLDLGLHVVVITHHTRLSCLALVAGLVQRLPQACERPVQT